MPVKALIGESISEGEGLGGALRTTQDKAADPNCPKGSE